QDVGDHQVGALGLDQAQGLGPIGRFEQPVPAVREQRGQELPVGGPVLDDEDGGHWSPLQSHTAMRSRPACLARYKAPSALDSRPLASSAWSGYMARPPESVTRTISRPASVAEAAVTLARSASRRRKAPSRLAPGMTIANSSPP